MTSQAAGLECHDFSRKYHIFAGFKPNYKYNTQCNLNAFQCGGRTLVSKTEGGGSTPTKGSQLSFLFKFMVCSNVFRQETFKVNTHRHVNDRKINGNMITKEEALQAYDSLIQYRRQDVLFKSKENHGKIEVHHIVPTSIGGTDNDVNKIALLAKEHFMAHVYLWIIHHDDEFHAQMTCALMNMHKGTKNGFRKELREFILMSEEYQQAREEFGKISSKMFSEANKGEKNPHFGQHWYKDPNSSNCKMFFDGDEPEGWIRGKYFSENERLSATKNITGRVWIHNKVANTNRLLPKNQAFCLVETGEWEFGHTQKPISKEGLSNIRSARMRQNYKYHTPKNKGQYRYINQKTNEIKYFSSNESIPEGFVKTKTLRKQQLEQQKAIKDNSKIEKELAKKKWLEETQIMADYYIKYGYEATCKKFNVSMSQESMLMRFIRARKLYGITFESQSGKKRIFKAIRHSM